MALADRLGWPGILNAADRTKSQPYVFEDADARGEVIPIPISMDQRLETLRNLNNHEVELQAEAHRIDRELAGVRAEKKRHEAAILDVLRDHGIAPQPPRIPEKPE